jgi:hypothetical protein
MPPSLTMVGPSIVKFTESLSPEQAEPYGTLLNLLKSVLANLVKMVLYNFELGTAQLLRTMC